MTNKAADKIDASCELEQMQRDLALHNHANREKILSDGVCIDCKEGISIDRLRVSPYVRRCIDCQELYELKKKQGAGFV